MTGLQALLESHQATRLLRMSFFRNDGPQATLMVNRFAGMEYLPRDFEFTVEILSDDARIELEAMQGKLLCISLVQADGSLRPFTGYVSAFKLVKTDDGIAFYEAILKPWLAYTRLRRNNRLFHAQSVREQADTIFANYGGLHACMRLDSRCRTAAVHDGHAVERDRSQPPVPALGAAAARKHCWRRSDRRP